MRNDPVNLVDPTGEIPSDYEAALMACYVYQDEDAKESKSLDKLKKLGWILSNFETSINMNQTSVIECGLQSVLFERTNNEGVTEYSYVFAETNSIEDVVEDFAQLVVTSANYIKG